MIDSRFSIGTKIIFYDYINVQPSIETYQWSDKLTFRIRIQKSVRASFPLSSLANRHHHMLRLSETRSRSCEYGERVCKKNITDLKFEKVFVFETS